MKSFITGIFLVSICASFAIAEGAKTPTKTSDDNAWGQPVTEKSAGDKSTSEKSAPQKDILKKKKKLKEVTPVPNKAAVRETQEVSPVAVSPEEVETRLTKNWGGARKKLSDKGIDIALIYKGEMNSVLSGGLRKRTEYLGNIDLRTSFDGDKLMGWKGGSAFIYVLADHGGHPSKNVGDLQGTSNIETTAATLKLYESWLQQLLYDDKVSLLFGMHDLNSEFYTTDTSGLFFNSSFGVGKELAQSGVNGPSIFPTTAPALRIRTEPSKSFYFQWAAFNGQAGDPKKLKDTHIRINAKDGLLLLSEMAYILGKEDTKQLPGKYGLGYWTYTRTFDHLTDTISTNPNDPTATVPVKANSHGIYFLIDQAFSESFSTFLRYGIASTEVNAVAENISAGMVFTGLVRGRDKDRVGLGATQTKLGSEYLKVQSDAGAPIKSTETSIELNYRFEALPGIALQPDYQYVVNPGGSLNTKHTSVIALRGEFTF